MIVHLLPLTLSRLIQKQFFVLSMFLCVSSSFNIHNVIAIITYFMFYYNGELKGIIIHYLIGYIFCLCVCYYYFTILKEIFGHEEVINTFLFYFSVLIVFMYFVSSCVDYNLCLL